MNHLKYIFIFLFSYCFHTNAQQMPSMKIDNDTTYFSSDISFPYWLKAGQSLQSLQNVKNVSIIEFDVDSNGNMKFSRIVSGNMNTPSTVPVGKVWKMEAIGLKTANSNSSNSQQVNDTSFQTMSGFSNTTQPSIFTSPKTFSTPGVFEWKVPPNVNRICIEVWGGGGAGGSSITNIPYGSTCFGGKGGGGGGGGYGYECFTVTPLSNYTVTVGGAEQTSSVGNLISATGGQNGTNATCNVNGLGGASGTSTAYFNNSGKAGTNGLFGGAGGDSGNIGLGGAATPTGACNSGFNGTAPGGGGSASHYGSCGSPVYSGNGANGRVIIYW